MSKEINPADWVWFGYPGHYILGDRCLFRLSTQVGGYLISTVGDLDDCKGKREREIGDGRKYETMVFKISGIMDCGCPETEHLGLDFAGYNNHAEAQRGHLAMCQKWSKQK